MSIELLKCPACGAPAKILDIHSRHFNCEYCNHSGYYTLEQAAEIISAPTGGLDYAVDIVMCIDATASMSPFINQVKGQALRFYDDLTAAMAVKHKRVQQLRVKVIAFRDYYEDGKAAMLISEFYKLPEQRDGFSRFVNAIYAKGGGDLPECGLEAVALAIGSGWTSAGSKRRHIIVLWTDTSSHPLEKDKDRKPNVYPPGLPQNLNELTDRWETPGTLTAGTKRLILFAPDQYPWGELSAHWSNTILFPSPAGQGLNNLDYRTILDSISNSV